MKRNLMWYVLLLFLIEGTIMPWLIPAFGKMNVQMAPHFVLAAILYIAIFMNRHYALVFGLVFGMLQDFIFYGHMIGLQAFSMGLTGYLTGLVFRNSHITMLSSFSIFVVGNLTYECIVYGLYRLFRIVEFSFGWALTQVIVPSLFINLLFALLIYVPARHHLEKMENNRRAND